MSNDNIVVNSCEEYTDGEYAYVVIPASEIPQDVLMKMKPVKSIEDVLHPMDSDNGNDHLDDSDEFTNAAYRYAKTMEDLIYQKADIEKQMALLTAGYVLGASRVIMCRIEDGR